VHGQSYWCSGIEQWLLHCPKLAHATVRITNPHGVGTHTHTVGEHVLIRCSSGFRATFLNEAAAQRADGHGVRAHHLQPLTVFGKIVCALAHTLPSLLLSQDMFSGLLRTGWMGTVSGHTIGCSSGSTTAHTASRFLHIFDTMQFLVTRHVR